MRSFLLSTSLLCASPLVVHLIGIHSSSLSLAKEMSKQSVGHDFGPVRYLLLNVFLIPSSWPTQGGQSVQVEAHYAIVSDLLTQFERYFVEPGQHLSYDVRNSVGHFTNCLNGQPHKTHDNA